MIGKLTGRVDHRAADHVLLDVNGVGYIIHCSDRTLAALPQVGEMAALYTELLVREDLLQLFGFLTLYEREWHRLLISVQGIGAKASMAILGTLGAEGIARAIAIGDWATVKAAPGVGPKIAQRVVNELKDKAPATMALGGSVHEALGEAPVEVIDRAEPASQPVAAPGSTGQGATRAPVQAEALSALQNLGYAPSEAANAVATAASDLPEANTPALIRAALRLLAPKE
ncbi:Holliday junction branch migration protein RuvA [Rhodophyticola sp. CCM32]|uniref:Holliday junction branch migration protein RuvA n=1 Tax=Rhodophyticola sp. CCM32 TaxID=2916397 RepID=UPI00107F225F|nr:Holliday junction branch migration protein RuvA [Rhodophyticola sp. CCM32]QBY00097.1 Holliday junction branch migration protein RuvA [Rhodophyticola sp. CCM32]